MATGARGVGKRAKFALLFFFGGFSGANFVKFGVRGGDGAGFAEDRNLEEAGVDGAGEVGDLFELWEGKG